MQTSVTLSPNVTIRSNSFDTAQINESVLCLEVGRDRFRILVHNVQNKVLYLEDYTFPSIIATQQQLIGYLPIIFRGHTILAEGAWQEIRISANTSSFTLVPKSLFRKEYAGAYLSLMRGSTLPAQEFATSYTHEEEDFLTVFSLEHAFLNYFSEAFPLQPITYVHQISVLIEATANLDRHVLTPDSIYLFFEDEIVTIIHRKEHKLLYCNRFGYKNVHDLVYYVLYVIDEQELRTDSVVIFLFGEITPFADTYTELSRFLPNMSFGQTPKGVKLPNEFGDLPEHRYLSLYGLALLKGE